jgi:hypothetical protein
MFNVQLVSRVPLIAPVVPEIGAYLPAFARLEHITTNKPSVQIVIINAQSAQIQKLIVQFALVEGSQSSHNVIAKMGTTMIPQLVLNVIPNVALAKEMRWLAFSAILTGLMLLVAIAIHRQAIFRYQTNARNAQFNVKLAVELSILV